MLLKADKVAGHCPRMTQAQRLLWHPAQPGCPGLWRSPAQEKRTQTPAIQSSWVKKTKLLLGFRATDKPYKFQKNHGCTWLQLFSCWHPEQTALLRSGLFTPLLDSPASNHRSSLQSLNYKSRRHFRLKEMRRDHSHPHQFPSLLSALISIRKSVHFAAAYTRTLLSQKIRCFASFIPILTLLPKQLLQKSY